MKGSRKNRDSAKTRDRGIRFATNLDTKLDSENDANHVSFQPMNESTQSEAETAATDRGLRTTGCDKGLVATQALYGMCSERPLLSSVDIQKALASDGQLYDIAHSTVELSLARAALMLRCGAKQHLSARVPTTDMMRLSEQAMALLQTLREAVRRLMSQALHGVNRVLRLAVRYAGRVSLVSEMQRVDQQACALASSIIVRALQETRLTPEQQHARHMLREMSSRTGGCDAQVCSVLTSVLAYFSRATPCAEDQARVAQELLVLKVFWQALCHAQTEARDASPSQVDDHIVRLRSIFLSEKFDIDVGISFVHYIVRSWSYTKPWLYSVQFVQDEVSDFHVKYVYQVNFSIPTSQEPLPKLVASVYFVIEFQQTSDKVESSIQVTYNVESSRLIHKNLSVFQEKWLVDIINIKLKFWKSIPF